MNITIQINTDGEAFRDERTTKNEVNNILTNICYIFQQEGVQAIDSSLTLKASNGNRCGTVTITESEV